MTFDTVAALTIDNSFRLLPQPLRLVRRTAPLHFPKNYVHTALTAIEWEYKTSTRSTGSSVHAEKLSFHNPLSYQAVSNEKRDVDNKHLTL